MAVKSKKHQSVELELNHQIWGRRIHVVLKSGYTRAHWVILESEFWVALELIAKHRKITIDDVLQDVNDAGRDRNGRQLSLAEGTRVYVARHMAETYSTKSDVDQILIDLSSELGKLDSQSKPLIFKLQSEK